MAQTGSEAGGRCPGCGGRAVRRHFPFCSQRCALLDLGKWLDGIYRIPGEGAARGGGAGEA